MQRVGLALAVAIAVGPLACKRSGDGGAAAGARSDARQEGAARASAASPAPAAPAWGVPTAADERDGAPLAEACRLPRGDALDAWLKDGAKHVREIASSRAPCAEDALLRVAELTNRASDDVRLAEYPVRAAALRELAALGGGATLAKLDELTTYPDEAARLGKRVREEIWRRLAARLGPTPGRRVAVALTVRAWRPRRLDVAPLVAARVRALGFEPVPADASGIDAILEVVYTEKEERQYAEGAGTSDWLDGAWLEPRARRVTPIHLNGEASTNTAPPSAGTEAIEAELQMAAGRDLEAKLAALPLALAP